MSRNKFVFCMTILLLIIFTTPIGFFKVMAKAFPAPSGEVKKAVVYFESIEEACQPEEVTSNVFHVEQEELTTEDFSEIKTVEQTTSKIKIFELTAYCPCEICCGEYAKNRPIDENGKPIVYGSTGERLTSGYSIAVDPNVIPYGSEVIIDGKIYKAQDCGGAIKGNRIDLFFESHQDCLNFGRQTKGVEIIEN